MSVPCEAGMCGYRERYRGELQRDCSLLAGMIINMREFDYRPGECPYATMAAMNEAGGLSDPVIAKEALDVENADEIAQAFGIGSGEKHEDLLD